MHQYSSVIGKSILSARLFKEGWKPSDHFFSLYAIFFSVFLVNLEERAKAICLVPSFLSLLISRTACVPRSAVPRLLIHCIPVPYCWREANLTGVWGEESQVHRVAQGSLGKLDSEVYQLPTWKRGSGMFASDKVTGTYLAPVFTFHLVNV